MDLRSLIKIDEELSSFEDTDFTSKTFGCTVAGNSPYTVEAVNKDFLVVRGKNGELYFKSFARWNPNYMYQIPTLIEKWRNG